ncbi:MAG: DUF4105 domain-containing protein [Muribaculaceae bacterium]|nr:DUF4105 domain-containing protein [Muribaculaceae bacterium]
MTLGVLLIGAILPASYASAQDSGQAKVAPRTAASNSEAGSYPIKSNLTASLLTCSPGPEVYELFGHEAIRIRGIDDKGMPVDTVWNYGVFDFAAPNFLYRFVKGETDYMVEPCPMAWFIGAYMHRGSGVTEQDLNLTQEETYTLRKLLQINSLEENRIYRYNYVRDNCSTRIVDIIDAAVAPRTIDYPDTVYYSTFRNAMRELHKNYPWYQFGIDLVLGGGLDLPVSSREELFAPLLLEQKAAGARFDDGRPLVKTTTILFPGNLTSSSASNRNVAPTTLNPDLPTLRAMGTALPPTPWLLSPMAISILVLAIALWAAWWQIRNLKILAWVYTIFFGLLGLAGCVVWFLVFFSSHDSTSPNLMSLWANPLQLAIAILIWWRSTRGVAIAMAAVDTIIVATLYLIWPFQLQCANPAIFPLWGATIILSLTLLIIRNRILRAANKNS